jgi:membrane-bound lytic murein transglycosylase A
LRIATILAMPREMTPTPNLPQASRSPHLQLIRLSNLAGWQADNHDEALRAFRRSCREILDHGRAFLREVQFAADRQDWLPVCQLAMEATDARIFFEDHFRAYEVMDEQRPLGLFTGYFEPEAEGSRDPSEHYSVPVYRKPEDLVSFDPIAETTTGLKYGRIVERNPLPYLPRKEIEQGALQGRGLEIAWLKNWDDAFFIHIQGSGRIKLREGGTIRLSYAAKTGLPYTAIGGVLIKRGILTPETNSMQSIQAWMKSHPGEARELMWANESFVFFREVPVDDETLGALGAQQVNLTPRRSLAVDRAVWAFGTPLWLDTKTPPETPGGAQTFRRLMVAQDTGSAIKGVARGDVYWGWGENAAQLAGHMKSPGNMMALLPLPVARRLGLET